MPPRSGLSRTGFFVDGFNLYHSLVQASDDLSGRPTRWLDLRSLLSSYLPGIGGGATLERIHYFSALATHMDHRRPGTTARHRRFIDCLQACGIRVELGRFKRKDVHCSRCNTIKPHYEEKETESVRSATFNIVYPIPSPSLAEDSSRSQMGGNFAHGAWLKDP